MMQASKRATPLDRIFSVKHAPKHLDEITGHEDSIERLRHIVSTRKVSHLLIAGPKGSGKLTLAKCFARDLLGDEHASSLNIIHAADPLSPEERKQANRDSYVSKSRIGSMAGASFTFPKFIQVRIKPVVELKAMNELGFKLLVVTDFDLLSQEQQGFRRLMEMYGRNCRFILITSQVSSIIDPIISRCQVLLVNPVTKARFYKEVSRVGGIEGFKVNYTFINALYYVAKGNIGQALNLLQLFMLKGLEINEDNLFKMLRQMQGQEMASFLQAALEGKIEVARDAYRAIKKRHVLGLAAFLDRLRRQALKTPLPQRVKARIIEAIADVDARQGTGANEEPHLVDLAFKLALAGKMEPE